MSGRAELRALTSARGVAAWWVVLYHLRGALAAPPLKVEAVLAKGYLAVDFFFLLSGFVLALRHGERLRGGGIAVVPDFLRRRVARIWPLHAVLLGFALLLLVLAASVALHRLVERPAQRWINRLGFRPRRSRLPARRSPRG